MALQVFGDLAIDPERVQLVSGGKSPGIVFITDDGAIIVTNVTEDSAEALLDFFEEDDRLPVDDLDDVLGEEPIVPELPSVKLPTKPGTYTRVCKITEDGVIIDGWEEMQDCPDPEVITEVLVSDVARVAQVPVQDA